jgi:hypothetical protein
LAAKRDSNDYMQVAPPMPAMMRFAQKLSEPPDWAKLQHLLAPVSVQSEGCVQSRTTSVPEQVAPESCVMHWAGLVHATERGPLVQLGIVPPVMGMFPQQTLPEPGQSEGFEQTWSLPESSPDELLPLLLPLPELPLPPVLPPPLLPLLLPDDGDASPSKPVEGEELPQATNRDATEPRHARRWIMDCTLGEDELPARVSNPTPRRFLGRWSPCGKPASPSARVPSCESRLSVES